MRFESPVTGSGTDLASAIAFVEGRQRTYYDEVPLSDLQVSETCAVSWGEADPLFMTEYAARQVSSMVGLPPTFILRAPSDVAAWNLMHFLPSQPGNVRIAVEDERIVSVVSAAVSPMSAMPILSQVTELDTQRMSIAKWSVDEEGLLVRLQSENMVATPAVGDIIRYGIDFMLRENSKEGAGIRGIFHRLACLNGATAPENTGVRRQFRKESWKDDTARAQLLMDALGETIVSIDEMAANLTALPTYEIPLPDEQEQRDAVIRPLLRAVSIPAAFLSSVSDTIRSEESSLYGFYNAVTRLGRDSVNAKARNAFERGGFRVLERLPRLIEIITSDPEEGEEE